MIYTYWESVKSILLMLFIVSISITCKSLSLFIENLNILSIVIIIRSVSVLTILETQRRTVQVTMS
jgi:hypothetical protein